MPAWLTLTALALLFSGKYLGVAVRDFIMTMGAFSMVKIARIVSKFKYYIEFIILLLPINSILNLQYLLNRYENKRTIF